MKTTDKIYISIFSAIIAVCAILIIRDVFRYRAADMEYDGLKEYIELRVDDREASDGAIKAAYMSGEISYLDELRRINPDIVGVLSIPCLNMSYPVVQGADNEEYLKKTFEGNENPSGCIFMDYENKNDFTDRDTYIYGHNMKNGSMFGSLKRLVKEDWDEDEVKAYIYTDKEALEYELDTAQVVSIDEYVPEIPDTERITLYTCWGNDKSRRLLVTFSKQDMV